MEPCADVLLRSYQYPLTHYLRERCWTNGRCMRL